MKESILMSLDTINDVVCESEIAAAEALLAEYDKALAILEYSETEPEEFGIFQEGKIMDDVKKQGEGQSKVMRILSFIPRLIAALFKAITGKLQTAAKSAKNVVENTKGKDQSKIKTFIEGLKKGDKQAVKTALIGLGAVAGVAGGAGVVAAHKYRDSKKPVQLQYADLIKNGLSEEDAKKFNECDKIMMDIYLSIYDDNDKITKPVSRETREKFAKAHHTAIGLFEKISVHKCMKVMRIGNIKFTQKELAKHLNEMADCLTDMIQWANDESAKNLQKTLDESLDKKLERIDKDIENTKNKIDELVKENEKELEKVDDKSEVNEEKPTTDEKQESKPTKNEPESSIKFPAKMDKAIDDIMKGYSDLQNSGDVKLIDFIYDPKIGLQVAYNGSVFSLCDVIGGLGYSIMNHPSDLEKFKSFYNSYSETVKKLSGNRFKTMTAAIAACDANNIGHKSVKKDQMWPIYGIGDEKAVKNFNDNAIEQFDNYSKGMKNDDDLKNNTEAIKAIETIGDIVKNVNSDILAYMSAIFDIITKLEDIFGYEKMWSHTDEKAWKSVREVHKS